MFSKPSAKLPPRIEKSVMDKQDVDFEMKYEPGRDEVDPLDFLSRHPLPAIGNDDTGRVLKAVITTEHAVVLDRIRKESNQDRVLRKLRQSIRKQQKRNRFDSLLPSQRGAVWISTHGFSHGEIYLRIKPTAENHYVSAYTGTPWYDIN